VHTRHRLAAGLAAPLALALFAGMQPAIAATELPKVTTTGNLRAYFFTRSFKSGTNQGAFSIGGKFHAESAPKRGLGVGATYFSALPAFNSDLAQFVDKSLPGNTVNVLGEAYGQYAGDKYLVRIGRQLIKTPWAYQSDSRVIPNAFQGAAANYNLSSNWSVYALRMARFKSRTSPTFDANDTISTKPTSGMLAFGTTYAKGGLATQAWYYRFYGTGKLAYVDAVENIDTHTRLAPYVGAQYVSDSGYSPRFGANIDGRAYGAKMGVGNTNVDFNLSYNNMPLTVGAFKNGGIASPYTYGDTDPLFTTSTGSGLVDKGAGHAYKLASTLWSANRRVRFIASRAQLFLYSNGPAGTNVLVTNLDTTVFLSKPPKGDSGKGLSIRNRWIDVDTASTPFTFINHRLQIEYNY